MHNDWQSMYQLGVIYFDGLGVDSDPVCYNDPNNSNQVVTYNVLVPILW